MKKKILISGGFVPTKVQSRKQITEAINEVEYFNQNMNKYSFNTILFPNIKKY